jgi:mannose-6-phosphate isomerase-like protein (cupin superfamily)
MASNGQTSAYTVKRLSDMERAFGGAFVRVRAELGITAFGVQVVELPPDSGELSPEHDHLHDGQEELFILLSGSAELALPDQALSLDTETLVRVAPETRRRLRSGRDGARVVIVGATPGRAYQPPENSRLGGKEVMDCPTASTAMAPDGPPPLLTT